MKIKKFAFLAATAALTGLCLSASAYTAGERSHKIMKEILNNTKQALHLVVVQKVDMSSILGQEAFQALKPYQRVKYNRFEYNEVGGLLSERQTTYDGAGRIIKDVNSFAKAGHWYSVDYLHKTYDRLPELPGMVQSLASTINPFFVDNAPEMGYDETLGYDFDRRYSADKEMYFYFEKDTENLKAYSIGDLPRYNVLEISDQVNPEKAFEMPPEGFKRQPNEAMRSYATRLVTGFKSKGKKK